ncbi:MAG TPA: MBL fold metallo-hydrolase, partial [Paracoccus sp. (in: a-proteobacteria)]|nr:MBL fold metallo-hydrolase [Paracoccus sp. (in: a-proteobacteria)]
MMLTRRLVLAGSAALAAGAMLPLSARRVWAVTTFRAGDVQVDSVSDGHLEFPADFVLGALPADERDDLIARFDLPTDRVESPLNVTLLRQGGRTILFDVGSGPDFMPTAGKLIEALDAIGVQPDDVTDVIFTHGHPDHLWGLLDEFDEPAFPDARLAMGQAEFDYWTDPATAETIGEERLSFAAGAMRRLSTVADRVERFADGDEVAPGVRAVSTPGHTPGHMSFALGSAQAGLFVIG